MPQAQSTTISHASSQTADGHGFNTPAGESKRKQPPAQQTTQTGSPTKWKPSLESASFSASITRDDHNSLLFAEDEISKRKAEMEGLLLSAQQQKPCPKKKCRKTVPTPNETHMKIRAAVDAADVWELELESKHGLSDLEACVCVGLVAKYQEQDSFPDSEPGVIQQFVDFAREGCRLMKEALSMIKKYPQESGEQSKINWEWKMIAGERTLQESRDERDRKETERKRKMRLRGHGHKTQKNV